MSGEAGIAAPAAGASRGSRPEPTRPVARPAFNIAVTASVLAAGVGLVGAGVAWAPSRDAVRAISRGAQIYAAECAGCHGGWLAVRWRPDIQNPPSAPSLGMAGHAWQHSDAELAAIVAHGTGSVALPGKAPGMPAFAGRFGRSDIDALLAYVKNGWPRSARTHQAALSRGGEEALAALLRDPAWVFPGQCLPPPGATGGR